MESAILPAELYTQRGFHHRPHPPIYPGTSSIWVYQSANCDSCVSHHQYDYGQYYFPACDGAGVRPLFFSGFHLASFLGLGFRAGWRDYGCTIAVDHENAFRPV